MEDLEKWAKEKNIGVEFNSKLSEWQKEYGLDVGKNLTDTELSAAKLSGVFATGPQWLITSTLLTTDMPIQGRPR